MRLRSFLFAAAFAVLGVARLGQGQVLDTFNPGVKGYVSSIAVQTDGKIVVGGWFSEVGGKPRSNMARLNPDGTVDPDFHVATPGPVSSLVIQPDGKILAAGGPGGSNRPSISRFNPADGSLDTTWSETIDGQVVSIALQPDGKVLAAGPSVARLLADGSKDREFYAMISGFYPYVAPMVLQPDGKIWIGGRFSTISSNPRPNLGRLEAWGQLDGSQEASADNSVSSLALQPDGRLIVTGDFQQLAGQSRKGVGRYRNERYLDGFTPEGGQGVVQLQADGKVYIAVRRYNSDGTADVSHPAVTIDGGVSSIALQPDGKLLIGGSFSTVNGETRLGLARLEATEPATQSLTFNGKGITWFRGGTAPEVWRTTFERFEYDAEGTGTWTRVGDGVRIPGGWELQGLALASNSVIRARGYVRSAGYNDYFVETVLRPEMVIVQSALDATGMIKLGAMGPFGQRFVTETSTDLETWAEVRTNTFRGNLPTYVEAGEPSVTANRFYRLRGLE